MKFDIITKGATRYDWEIVATIAAKSKEAALMAFAGCSQDAVSKQWTHCTGRKETAATFGGKTFFACKA